MVRIVLPVLLALAGGCSCGDDDDPAVPRVTETIDGAGGALVSADGMLALYVPAGALTEAVDLFVEGTAGAEPAGILGIPYLLGPEGTEFREPATLTLRFEAASLGGRTPHGLRAATQSAAGGLAWNCIAETAADTDNGLLTASITHLSRWALVYDECDVADDCLPPESCTADGFCAIACTRDDECGVPRFCLDGVCALTACDGDRPCPHPDDQDCSRDDGQLGVCGFRCGLPGAPLPEGTTCGEPQTQEGLGQFACTARAHCVLTEPCEGDTDCVPYEAEYDKSCLHGWCVLADLGSAPPIDCDETDCSHPGAGEVLPSGLCACCPAMDVTGTWNQRFNCEEDAFCVDDHAESVYEFVQDRSHVESSVAGFAIAGTLCGTELVWTGGPDDGEYVETGVTSFLDDNPASFHSESSYERPDGSGGICVGGALRDEPAPVLAGGLCGEGAEQCVQPTDCSAVDPTGSAIGAACSGAQYGCEDGRCCLCPNEEGCAACTCRDCSDVTPGNGDFDEPCRTGADCGTGACYDCLCV